MIHFYQRPLRGEYLQQQNPNVIANWTWGTKENATPVMVLSLNYLCAELDWFQPWEGGAPVWMRGAHGAWHWQMDTPTQPVGSRSVLCHKYKTVLRFKGRESNQQYDHKGRRICFSSLPLKTSVRQITKLEGSSRLTWNPLRNVGLCVNHASTDHT